MRRVVVLIAFLLIGCGSDDGGGLRFERASTLLDLSGLAWLGGHTFVGVHDAKNPDELDQSRVSIITLPTGAEGILFRDVDLDWPAPLGASSDLEGVAAVPGENLLLFAESGDDGDPDFHRIFLVHWDGENLTLVDYTDWPVDIFNVEAIAVGQAGDGYVFLYAERAEGMPSTQIRWASFVPASLEFGSFSSVTFDNPDPNTNRPIVGMDVGSTGTIYVVTAFDPDEDNGPFYSSVWVAGELDANGDVVLDDEPELAGVIDGFKTESVAIRDQNGMVEVFIGTDDENLGNVLRPLP
jgi:hypothetical protein